MNDILWERANNFMYGWKKGLSNEFSIEVELSQPLTFLQKALLKTSNAICLCDNHSIYGEENFHL